MGDSIRFGVATADHQCEAYDGRDDVRDAWERVRGLVPRGRATDFWNRYPEDVELARSLGCTIFRLSLSWARLEPEPGRWDDDAFTHYREVLQAIRGAGMQTVVTLVHNTWPLHVQSAGNGASLLDPAYPQRMAAFAAIVADRLGDLIDYYVTLNEPNQLVYGWIRGFWMRSYAMPPGQPPYMTSDRQMDDVLALIPNLFRAHAQSREAIRKRRPDARVGANPLVLGLPRWLQRIVDRQATHVTSPEQIRRHAARLSQTWLLEGGRVDCSIAQLTMTPEREATTMFSEPYFTAHLCLLRNAAKPMPENHTAWDGRIGVVSDMLPARIASAFFPDARLQFFADATHAAQALRAGDIDAIFDDDVVLQPLVRDGFTLERLPAPEQHFAVAMPFGARTLLNVVDHVLRELKRERPDLPQVANRRTLADIGRAEENDVPDDVPHMDRSVIRIRKRGKLRVGVHPGVATLCEATNDAQRYTGLEAEIARRIAQRIFGDSSRVEFVPLHGDKRFQATRSWLQALFALRKSIAIFGTLLGTNWWNLGMAGKLPAFLCPPECVGTLDYVGLDYYWGVPSFWPDELHRLSAASQFKYSSAPVWPSALEMILREQSQEFPDKPIIVIENGCVTEADGFTRAAYLEAHVREVRRAAEHGVPIAAYLCWSITSNREWGLAFDDNSDFGLFHIDLDTDPALARKPTEASAHYARLIASNTTSTGP